MTIEQAFQARLSIFAATTESQIARHAEHPQREKSASDLLPSIRPHWHCRRRVGFATASMSSRLPSRLACSAAGVLQMLIICALRNHWPLGARSAMSLPSPLCRGHHRQVHHSGDEATWWNKAGIDRHTHCRQLRIKRASKTRSRETSPAFTEKQDTVASLANQAQRAKQSHLRKRSHSAGIARTQSMWVWRIITDEQRPSSTWPQTDASR
jgi:hypothetical protein